MGPLIPLYRLARFSALCLLLSACARKAAPLTPYEELEKITLDYYRAFFKYQKAMDKLEAEADSIKDIPDFSFTNLDGTPYTKTELAGKPAWLLFFSSGCSHCQEELSQLRPHVGKFGTGQLVLISDEPVDSLVAFRKRDGWDAFSQVRLVRDLTKEGFYKFKVTATPTSFVFDKEGKKVFHNKGVVPDSTLQEIVSRIGVNR